ncbi:cystathionine beta-lyase [Magnetospira sp. QH-2]|uniref:cystathionine beta-lyase n=1 Tax=Magnetospira sp. (strain QH-2) TaxID=1288970 RepID=UPI0003E818B8|nr:cystathionine beta-lyase [Magnetospira sp. QH-2]CCQ73500.1 Cystathionine beta-lyase, PLP-dependent (beta-cystathionase) [Magnetospira sp. QH-2]
MKKDTRLTTVGRKPEDNHGIVNPPVYHASTVTFPSVAALEESQRHFLESIHYGRFGTPTTRAFEEAVADLEGGSRCISLPSGLAAITATLLALVKQGDHILVTDSVYFPTRKFCDRLLAGLGIKTTYYDPRIGSGIAELMRPETRLIFTESPGSLSFEIQDLPAIAAAAHAGDALVVLDNTWSAGFYMQAFELGVDISIQAATKFIVGHSDAMLGTVTVNDEALYFRLKEQIVMTGNCAGPDDCYLGLRGLRSLSPRLARHQESGLALAQWLETRPEVAAVLHPALPSFPDHELWKRDFTGSVGLFGVVFQDHVSIIARNAFLDALEHFALGYSWGGYESLAIPANPASIRTASDWPYKGPCVRLHVGLDDVADLREDLEKGLAALNAAST